MPSGNLPAGFIAPEKGSIDVKKNEDPSSSEKAGPKKEASSSESIEESDLQVLDEAKKIPYQRFKEVNDKSKTLQKQLEEFNRQKDSDIRRAVEDAETRILTKFEREKNYSIEDEIDPTKREIKDLRSQLSELTQALE